MSGDSKVTSAQRREGSKEKPLSGEDVAAYLRNHRDFLSGHPDLLENIDLPSRWSGDDGVVDMQKFVLERLRGEVDNLRSCAIDLIETSRLNMSNQSRTNTAVLAVLSANDLDHGIHIITEDLPLFLDVDVVGVGFEPTKSPLPGLALPSIQRLPAGTVEGLLNADKDAVLMASMLDDGTLFGSGAGLVRSAALARLRGDGNGIPEGLLALGSRREGSFHPGQGTEVLIFLARVLERCLHGWLARPV
jgi:uncharacterized protein YigA (DUF484 family)